MQTDKKLLVKGLKFLGYTVALMFLAPIVTSQAFKNQEHPAYLPVLIAGILLGTAAIGLGFYSIKVLMDSLFGKKSKR